MGHTVKGITRTTYEPGRTVTGKAAKAAHCWLWELCKAGRVASWTWTKGEGFRVAWTEEEHRAYSGRDDWGYLDVHDADAILSRCADLDPSGEHVPAAHADTCRRYVDPPAPKVKRQTVAQLRSVLADLSALDLPAEARALLAEVAA